MFLSVLCSKREEKKFSPIYTDMDKRLKAGLNKSQPLVTQYLIKYEFQLILNPLEDLKTAGADLKLFQGEARSPNFSGSELSLPVTCDEVIYTVDGLCKEVATPHFRSHIFFSFI